MAEMRLTAIAARHAAAAAGQLRAFMACAARDVTFLLAVAEAARELLAQLPRCDHCARAATRAFARGEARYCDPHGTDPTRARYRLVTYDRGATLEPRMTFDVAPEYPRAAAVRALEALLFEKAPRDG